MPVTIHPGEYLKEIITELDISQAELARALDILPMRISHVIKGKRPITADLALRLGKALHRSPAYWINLQTTYDLATVYLM
jgi:addiction module HigA family antidote